MTSLRHGLGAGALWLSLASLPGVASASDLSWSGPAECRQSEQLTFQVERALGAPLAQVGQVHLQVHVEQLEPDARALLRIAEGASAADAGVKKRLLTAPDCAGLVDTLAVAIALAVEAAMPEPAAAVDAGTTFAAPPLAAAAEPSVQRDATPRAAPPVLQSAARLVPGVAAALQLDAGSLPAPAFGVGLSAALGGAHWRLELLGTLWLEQHPSLAGGGAGADLSLGTGAVLGCVLPGEAPSSALALSLCTGMELGRLAGEGTGVTNPRQQTSLWLAPGLHAGLSWHIPETQLRLAARIGAVVPLERHEFVLDGLGAVYQPANLAARAALGLDWRLE